MDKDTAYNFGFFLKCAEAGMSASEAAALQNKIKSGYDGAIGTLLSKALGLATLGIPLSAGVGLGGGYLLGKTSRRPAPDDEVNKMKQKIRNEELAAMYKIEAEKALRKAKFKQYRASQPAPPRPPQLF